MQIECADECFIRISYNIFLSNFNIENSRSLVYTYMYPAVSLLG